MMRLKYYFVDILISIFGWILRSRKLSATEKVNIGCGLICLPGWVNIDGSLNALLGSRRFKLINRILYSLSGSSAYYSFSEYNRVIQECGLTFSDIRQGLPLQPQKTSFIFCCHFLEHLNQDDAKVFLKRCKESLKSGGSIRILVPDLDVAFKMYQSGQSKEMLEAFFYTSNRYDFSYHKYNYNFEILSEFLKEAGFTSILRCEFKKGLCPDIDVLDAYPEHSLIVEAIA
jgi:predicted SAM-dependent methyltransferase